MWHSGWEDEDRLHRDGFDQGWHDKLTKDLPAVLVAPGAGKGRTE